MGRLNIGSLWQGLTGDKDGAGDQGIMFGYAVDETDELMPAPIQYAHAILRRLADARKSGAEPTLGHKLFQVEFLTTLAGDALITLCYHRPLDDAWEAAATLLAEVMHDIGLPPGRRAKAA